MRLVGADRYASPEPAPNQASMRAAPLVPRKPDERFRRVYLDDETPPIGPPYWSSLLRSTAESAITEN